MLKNIISILLTHFYAITLCFILFIKKTEAKIMTKEDKKTLIVKPRKDEKTILCTDEKVQKVRVTFGRITTLNFPVAPKEVLPGDAVFDFKQIRNDLNIKALSPKAKTNIAVYLQERRCSLDLITVPFGGDDILFIRDPAEKQFEVRFQ